MATTQMLYMLTAPLTQDHGICLLQNTPYSGFYIQQGTRNLIQNCNEFFCKPSSEEQDAASKIDARFLDVVQAAEARIQARDDLADKMAVALAGHSDAELWLRDPGMQLMLLAPHLMVGESCDISSGHPFWGFSQRMSVIDSNLIQVVLDAMGSSSSPEDLAMAETLLFSHLGQLAVIQSA